MGAIRPGLVLLHGNRTELLADAVFEWLRREPLAPLEEEVFLVQSNGVAEWLKMALASQSGVCAATRVELPGRFLWRACRQVLGRQAVPARSALDKEPLTWRLMQRLPALACEPGFEPLAGFLRDDSIERRLQLARRLADLFDQYQIYRPDWLAVWARGDDRLPRSTAGADTAAEAMPTGQRWQAALWRDLLASLDDAARAAARPQLQARLLVALERSKVAPAGLARRVVVFGMSQLPPQTLQTLAALARHSQVLLALLDPCRFHWADSATVGDLLRGARARRPPRPAPDPAGLPPEALHAHAHPLLAAWGRQGRDFARQLDAFDDAEAAAGRAPPARIDYFDEAAGTTLLQQVQTRIRDGVPLAEHAAQGDGPISAGDRSIVFHVAHSAQREVEILHDQLLDLLATDAGGAALQPRDIVVMVPAVADFAPAILSVFGQYGRGDARFIPYAIADLHERGHDPLLVALEWLLRLPQQRCNFSGLRDLLDVPAVAARFGLEPDAQRRLTLWMQGAGVRWGLDADHRAALGLGECGAANTVLWGLRRMLLGYASGAGADFADIEPWAEVGGLEAEIVGALAALVNALSDWLEEARAPAPPAVWADRLRALLEAFFSAGSAPERLTLAALHEALRAWLDACETADFTGAVPLAVVREAWLAGVDEPSLGQRYRAGGVTFCTLLPMRAIPFEVVCLLGMNDGDYPRAGGRSDFDLMALPGQARAGDRSRRDDDRQLMLEALLSARRVLYVSWAGRNVRDNSDEPPSVLVSQLRDYLDAGWPDGVVAARTTEHPLQPFSRRYFEVDPFEAARGPGHAPRARLHTHAREWRAAYLDSAAEQAPPLALLAPAADAAPTLTVAALARFLKNPVQAFFRSRLDVVFGEIADAAPDDEPFGLTKRDAYRLLRDALADFERAQQARAIDSQAWVRGWTQQVLRSGLLPQGELGHLHARVLADRLRPMLAQWQQLQQQHPDPADRVPLHFEHAGLQLRDGQDGLRAEAARPGMPVWIELTASNLVGRGSRPRGDRLVDAWVRSLASVACGVPLRSVIVGRDAVLRIEPPAAPQARACLATLIEAWWAGQTDALPLACKTALAWAAGRNDVAAVYEGHPQAPGEVAEACLARVYPDYAALVADGRFPALAGALYRPLLQWADAQVDLEWLDADTGD